MGYHYDSTRILLKLTVEAAQNALVLTMYTLCILNLNVVYFHLPTSQLADNSKQYHLVLKCKVNNSNFAHNNGYMYQHQPFYFLSSAVAFNFLLSPINWLLFKM